MKKERDIVRGQCDQCGLIGDRTEYTDGSSSACEHCDRKTGYREIR